MAVKCPECALAVLELKLTTVYRWCNSRACVRVCGSKPRSHVRFIFVLAAITPVYSKKNLVVQHVLLQVITSQESFCCSYIHCRADECQ